MNPSSAPPGAPKKPRSQLTGEIKAQPSPPHPTSPHPNRGVREWRRETKDRSPGERSEKTDHRDLGQQQAGRQSVTSSGRAPKREGHLRAAETPMPDPHTHTHTPGWAGVDFKTFPLCKPTRAPTTLFPPPRVEARLGAPPALPLGSRAAGLKGGLLPTRRRVQVRRARRGVTGRPRRRKDAPEGEGTGRG